MILRSPLAITFSMIPPINMLLSTPMRMNGSNVTLHLLLHFLDLSDMTRSNIHSLPLVSSIIEFVGNYEMNVPYSQYNVYTHVRMYVCSNVLYCSEDKNKSGEYIFFY